MDFGYKKKIYFFNRNKGMSFLSFVEFIEIIVQSILIYHKHKIHNV